MARVLLTDDELLIGETLSIVLSRAGHQVHTASTGLAALSILDVNPIDVLIADIVMPDMDGLELIREVRNTDWKTGIIAISGGPRGKSFDYLPSAAKLGADRVFNKPVPHPDLLRAVMELSGGPARGEIRYDGEIAKGR